MSFSVLPEILSPSTSPAISIPLSSSPAPQEQIVSPAPDTTVDPAPPAIPPVADGSSPPVNSVSPPPPATRLSPPSPAPEIPPAKVSSPPPAAALPGSPPLSPKFASPPPPDKETPVSPPPVESPPPPAERLPSPASKDTPPAPHAPENTNSPPPEPPPVITPPSRRSSPPLPPSPNSEVPVPEIPPPALSPLPSSATTAPPALSSPPSPPSFFPPSAAETAANGSFPATAVNGSFPAAVQIQKPQPDLKLSPVFIAGCVVVSLLVVAVFVSVVACVVFRKRRRRITKASSLPALPKYYSHTAPTLPPKDSFSTEATTLPPPPIKTNSGQNPGQASHGAFSYSELAAATGGFSESNLVGEGGFGCVYKGVLGGGKEVAVKQLRAGGQQGEREFRAEVDIISRIHHKHLVSLVGYCITGAERLLVYEFVPNHTLDFHLHGKQERVMEWETRVKIAVGAAKGLAYLHEDCNPKVIHRDIKASNILLDFRFEAKVSDFGLAKSFSDTNTHISHISTRVVGTFGYLAPEYASSGKVTEKSDVYSYGVVLLELITGRPPISSIDPIRNQALVEWARPLLAQAMEDRDFDTLADPGLQRSYDADEMSRMVACAAACVRHSAWLRPRMSQIVHSLEGHASVSDLHEGVAPGSSTLYSSPGSTYTSRQYRNDMKKFHIALRDQEYGNESMHSGSTSEYGLDPSVSSGEVPSQNLRH